MKIYGVIIDGVVHGRLYPSRKSAIDRCRQFYELNTSIHQYTNEAYNAEKDAYQDFNAWFDDFVTNGNDMLEVCIFELIEE